MKNMMKLIALLCALVLVAGVVCACGAEKPGTDVDTTTEPVDDGLTDFGWVKLKMPDGFSDAKESDSYITLEDDNDSDRTIKVFNEHIFSEETLDSIVEKDASYSDKYSVGEDVTIGGYTWKTVNYTFNDKPSKDFYTQLDDENYMKVDAFTMTEADEAVKTVLSSIVADPTKIE